MLCSSGAGRRGSVAVALGDALIIHSVYIRVCALVALLVVLEQRKIPALDELRTALRQSPRSSCRVCVRSNLRTLGDDA